MTIQDFILYSYIIHQSLHVICYQFKKNRGSVSATGVLNNFRIHPPAGVKDLFFGGMTMIRKPTVNVMHEQSPCHMSAPVHPGENPLVTWPVHQGYLG